MELDVVPTVVMSVGRSWLFFSVSFTFLCQLGACSDAERMADADVYVTIYRVKLKVMSVLPTLHGPALSRTPCCLLWITTRVGVYH